MFKSDLWSKEPPSEGMFIWAYWSSSKNQWNTGLGYRNVSGGWSDAYSHFVPRNRTIYFHPMPEPPNVP